MPLPPPAGPASAITCTVTRRNEMSPLSRIKSLNFLDSVLARQEAAARNADEALLLNTHGRLAEASAANVFVLRGNALLTPPLAHGALPGIMREMLIERCGATEAPLFVGDIFAADASFLSSSLGLRSLVSLDGRPLSTKPDRIADFMRRVMVV
ncbi:MAG: aminotransferase class IV [Rhodospirillales bacterium]|nr:aminotransferase class IV [Rhodospirillales bacterium]